MPTPFTVAIVGAGFSGVMTAVHLLRARTARPIRVMMVNRSGAMARGVAYGTNSPGHLLNVPAAKMSAFPDDPSHFLRYVQSRDPSITPGAFVRRSLYGEYLLTVLDDTITVTAPNQLVQVIAEVKSIRPGPGGAILQLHDGHTFDANRVVLAVGNYPPANPPGLPDDFLRSPLYVRDPWARAAVTRVPAHLPVLLVGTGLTMLDVAIELRARGIPNVVAISRRGLLPRGHNPMVGPAEPSHRPATIDQTTTARGYVASVRAGIRQVEARGGNWRQVIDSLRPITSALWQRLPTAERAKFLRHLRAFWDVHRHRAAPETMATIDSYVTEGWLTVRAGRFVDVKVVGDVAEVAYRPRGQANRAVLRVGAVVNCTGPTAVLTAADDPLLSDLFATGLARPDPLSLGLEVAPDGAVIGRDGIASDVIDYVGPLLRARDGEGTAVPELRVHAFNMACRIVAAVETSAASIGSYI